MNIQDFILKLGDIFEDTDISNLTPTTNFQELDEWTSLYLLAIIAFADEEYGKEIDGSDIRNANTIQDLYDLITK